MIALTQKDFGHIWTELNRMMSQGPEVNVGEWQAIKNAPQSATIELEDVSFSFPISQSRDFLAEKVEPNLPWAEEHFQERVSAVPYNPPPSHERWPHRQKNNADHIKDQKFSHTYPERFWPKHAGNSPSGLPHCGIRYRYADLADLVELLRSRPHTRQAYLPVWFPEDGQAALYDERVPCTLGYHFMRRGNYMKCIYYIRSCDLYRHFRDDVYLAGRLLQWIVSRLRMTRRDNLQPGRLVMHISSLHIFAPEREKARQEWEKKAGQVLAEEAWW